MEDPLQVLLQQSNKRVAVLCKDDVEMIGTLVTIDQHVNLVLKDCYEVLGTDRSQSIYFDGSSSVKQDEGKYQEGSVRIVRGDNVLSVSLVA